MAAKLLHSLADDNPDLQKQIGCMTGIFQLFDRQHIVTPKRITGHSLRKPSSGSLNPRGGSSQFEQINVPHRVDYVANYSNKTMHEKQRVSTESSRASFSSSSRSSSFSSLDCNKAPQPETLSLDRITFPETPSREPGIIQQNASPQIGQQTVDLRDVVKDSFYKEGQGMSVKTAARQAAGSTDNQRYSPRPMQPLNTDDGSYGFGSGGKQDLSHDLKESLRMLAKLRDAPSYFNEPRELSRSASYHAKDGSSFSVSKDPPRFSYDGREIRRSSFESRESFNSSLKQKDFPRFSLESREGPMRNFNADSISLSHLKSLNNETSSSNDKISMGDAPATQARPPSVVAKLMGLETLPESAQTGDGKIGLSSATPVEDASFSRSTEASDLCRPIRTSGSSKNIWKEPNSPRSVMKPISRFPIEPAPWKQMDSPRGSQKSAPRNLKAPAKSSGPFPSVYSEIERRLKDIEFSQSGKDLRALKQILEAMQAKGLLETTQKECHDSNFLVDRDNERKYTSSAQIRKFPDQQIPQDGRVTTSARRGPSSLRNSESPIVIMKPAKLVEKSGIPPSSVIPLDSLPNLPKLQGGDLTDDSKGRGNSSRTAKDQIPKVIGVADSTVDSTDMKTNRKTLKSRQTLIRSQQLPRENPMTSVKCSGSISPRMQQRKHETEKHSRPPTPPSDSTRLRRQSGRQSAEANSPGGRRRPKYPNPQPGTGSSSEVSSQPRDVRSHGSELSAELDGNIILDPKVDNEVTPSKGSLEHGSMPTRNVGHNGKISTPMLGEDMSSGTAETPEYPSPVSVLDSALCNDDSTSPVKQITRAPEGDKSQEYDEFTSTLQYSSADNVTPNSNGSGLTSDISRKKLRSIENLVEKLRRLNSSHDEARTDYIASLCENSNPDDRYISEILLASGLLLRDLGSGLTTFQFHSTGHPLNPELFLVLEQTRASTLTKEECGGEKASKERFHRKLIFDAVNEILAAKLVSLGPSSDPWSRPHKLARKTLKAQQLLRELCSEIEQLQTKKPAYSVEDEDDGLKSISCEDVINCSEGWTDFSNDPSGIVLDVERLIFKDLVDEVVIGESTGLRIRPSRRRKLFKK